MKVRGMTLLEVMLSLALLAVALLSIVGVFTGGLSSMARSSELTEATELGREVLERIKSRGYSALPPGDSLFDGSVPTDIDTAHNFPPSPYPTATLNGRTYTITVISSPETVNVMSVQVQVSWVAKTRGKIVLETYLHP